MLIRIISQYLETHKRLVVPQLGAFIVKEPEHTVLFSELLKRDDGVLRGLLQAEGVHELEAAGEIDRFVFEVRHAVEHGTPCPLPGFGTLCPGANGTIAFRYEPDPALLEGAAAAQSAEPEPPQPESPTAPAADPRPADIPQSHAEPAPAAAVPAPSENIGSSPDFPEPRPVKRSATAAFTEPHISPSAKMNPDPSVRGLRYGKPPKNTNAYTYVGRAPRRRADRFIWIAVIAAVLALAAIGYGYYRDMRERQLEEAEWIDFSAPASAAPEASETPAAGDTSEQPM
ncbi:hypothetical protein [uncultured Alistipes sp.]|uniref:hypothetical protein n=1 Tax=uncultured Alistipes sp. TaxID=538949 RepID=UPI001F9038C3|nr:hypothetical protein [uncultured Alistipes sp.]HJC26171.1 hypothetical protein [Candidatus Alistipes stercoravium]